SRTTAKVTASDTKQTQRPTLLSEPPCVTGELHSTATTQVTRRTLDETSPLRLSTASHVRATTYVYWSLCSSSQLRAISARDSSRNWYQLCSKPSRRIALRNARKAPAP